MVVGVSPCDVVIFKLKFTTFCPISKVTDLTLLQVLTVGALHQADSTALRVAASAWHDELAALPKPLLVVNVGGPTGILFCAEVLIMLCLLYFL